MLGEGICDNLREKQIEVSLDSIIIISGVLKAIQLIVVWLLIEAPRFYMSSFVPYFDLCLLSGV